MLCRSKVSQETVSLMLWSQKLVLIFVVLPYKSPLQPYVAYATTLIIFLVVFFSGYAVFFPGNFTAAGFLTYYINIAIFAGMLMFF